MVKEIDVARWKTGAWQDGGMVDWYAGRMAESWGTNRLKNAIETLHVVDHVRGGDILDVGVGTGRAAIPLARAGHRVTAVDASPAMLAKCRELAGDLPIDLRQADVGGLPFADGRFDSLVSLNVMVHFPNWREILHEWRRVVKPGGRIVFDVHSLDHVRAAKGIHLEEKDLLPKSDGQVGEYALHISVADLVAVAGDLGLGVAGVVPYGALVVGNNLMLPHLFPRSDWQRLLGWMAEDDFFLAACVALEQALAGRLPATASNRFMAVLEADSAALVRNKLWLERYRQAEARLARARDCRAVAASVGLDADSLRKLLASSMGSPRFRQAMFRLGMALEERWRLDVASFLEGDALSAWRRWRRDWRTDEVVTHFVEEWDGVPALASVLNWRGLPLGPGFSWTLAQLCFLNVDQVLPGERLD